MSEGVDQWLVVGGRRWARIVAGELCAVLPPDRSIQLQASRSEPGLLEWWNASPYKQRIEIVDDAMPCEGTGVALIVNSAHEHKRSVEQALDAGYHAVCEKPLTFSRDDTLQLLDRADERGRKLFCTNTYLFADYLREFRRHWLQGKTFSELELTWADARGELRHGEAKSYDSSVPVIFDVLPHLATIVLATHGPFDFDRSTIAVERGGSAVTTRFDGGDLTVRASMARNAALRTRVLRFSGPAGSVSLDFTSEPGVVNGVSADSAWQSRRKPIAQMLESVKAYFEDGVLDARLGPEAALLANTMIDGIAEDYVQHQIDFLEAPAGGGEDSAYATKEAEAIRQRVSSRPAHTSPLQRLAMFNRFSRTLS